VKDKLPSSNAGVRAAQLSRLTTLGSVIAMNRARVFLLFALLPLASLRAFSADLGNAEQVASATRFHIRSEILNEERVVFVYLPDAYGAEACRESRYPVLYLLDGRAYLELTSGIAHHLGSYNAAVQRIPDLIVVAIQNTNRSRDMTPTRMTAGPYSSGSGGAVSFRNFLENELIPAIDRRFRTSDARILVGHSLAGLFVLDTYLEKPGLFDAYIASDPSLWWDNNLLARRLSGRSSTIPGTTARVFIAQANTPDSVPGEHDAHKAGITAFRTAMGRQKPPAFWLYRYFDDETHLSVPLEAIYRGLLFVYDGYAPPRQPTSAVAPPNNSLERIRER